MHTGFTNTSGVAILRTHGFDGVPAGEYTVTVIRRVVEGATLVTNPLDGSTREAGGTIYQTVDVQYTDTQSSPLSIEVLERGKTTDTFDVGAPVRVFLGVGA